MSDDPRGDFFAANSGNEPAVSADPRGDFFATGKIPDGPVTTTERPITPFWTALGHDAEDVIGGFAHMGGNAVDIATGTAPGEGSHAARWSAPFQHEPNYMGPEAEGFHTLASEVDPYKIIPEGPARDTLRERVPQFLEGAALATTVGGAAESVAAKRSATRAAVAIEENHPLTAAAKEEQAALQAKLAKARQADPTLAPQQTSPGQRYVNNQLNEDLGLPKNSPATSRMIDEGQGPNYHEPYKAARSTGAYIVGPAGQAAVAEVPTELLSPGLRARLESPLMDGGRAMDLHTELKQTQAEMMRRDVANAPTTEMAKAAQKIADAHGAAAEAVLKGFDEANPGMGKRIADARAYKARSEAWRETLDGNGNASGAAVKAAMRDAERNGTLISPQMEAAAARANAASLKPPTSLGARVGGAALRMGGAAVGGHLAGPIGAAAGEHVAERTSAALFGK